jgi:hypothetical protein
MTDQSPIGDNTTKDPDEWVTGDEAMTGGRASEHARLIEAFGP